MKRILSISLILSLTLLCFTACSSEMSITDEYYTDYDGVYISIEEIDSTADFPTLKVIWHNETTDLITFGLWYTVEYLDGDEWINIQIVDYAIPEIACQLEANSTAEQSYATKYFNMLRPGTYRIRTEFYVPDANIGAQSTWTLFKASYL